MPKRRIFVSIDIPEELRKKENWHITVVFCGYLDSEELLELKKKTEEIAKETKKFELTPDKIIFKDNRMIWLTFKYSPEFVNLCKKFSVFNVQPHVTLSRTKIGDLSKFKNLLPANPFLVEAINIMESHLSRQGAKYELICQSYLK